jgi:hypothetical protein
MLIFVEYYSLKMKLGGFYDSQIKHQSCEWKSKSFPQNQKFCLDNSKGKSMEEIFCDVQDNAHYEFIPEEHTLNKGMYVKNLCCFRDAVRMKYLEKRA